MVGRMRGCWEGLPDSSGTVCRSGLALSGGLPAPGGSRCRQEHHGLQLHPAIAGHAREALAGDRHVNGVERGFPLLVVDVRVVHVDEVLVEAGDDHPIKKTLISSSRDQTIRIWDIEKNCCKAC